MIKKISRYARVVPFAFLAACATLHTGPTFTEAITPTQVDALVYLYRPFSPPLWLSPTIDINGTTIGDLYNKGYTYLYLKPGDYFIKTKWSSTAGVKDLEYKFSIKGGETEFIRLGGELSVGGSYLIHTTYLGTVPNDAARNEIAGCMYFKPIVERLQ